jgi:hypothetical protein
MSKFADCLRQGFAREHGPRLAHAERPASGRARRLRPGVLAGSTLGLAGVGVAIALALSAQGGGGRAADAPRTATPPGTSGGRG